MLDSKFSLGVPSLGASLDAREDGLPSGDSSLDVMMDVFGLT